MSTVKLSDLLDGFEFSNFDGACETLAYVCRETGVVYCTSEDAGLDEALPEDLETSDRYVVLPCKADLDLGRELVFSFVEEACPDDYEAVVGYFRKRGAYARFKDLLDRKGLLERWYAFEKSSTEAALRQWGEENGFEVVA